MYSPLWGSALDWTSINGELAGLVSENAPTLGPAIRAAQEVRQAMERLIPVWEQLCAATYAQCKDNCCTAQRVWFEFRDLLLFHLLGLAIPPGQTRAVLNAPCRYLTPRGCGLPRLTRPWRCSWYLCQDQVDLLATRPPREQRRVSRLLGSILENRESMELSFRAALGY